MIPLTCSRCGAPFPPPAPNAIRFVCAYCGTTSLVGADGVRAESDATDSGIARDPQLALRVIETFKNEQANGRSSVDAIREAAKVRLGPMGASETFARVCLALGTDFDKEHGTHVVDDPLCMSRIIEVYLQAMEVLRARRTFDAHIPFFVATGAGPIDFRRTLDASTIATLAARELPKPRRRFWPFG